MTTPNEELAGGCGQEATDKEPLDAVKKKEGTYKCPLDGTRPPLTAQPPSPKQPFTVRSK